MENHIKNHSPSLDTVKTVEINSDQTLNQTDYVLNVQGRDF